MTTATTTPASAATGASAPQQQQPMFTLTEQGNLQGMEELIRAGPEPPEVKVNQTDTHGQTPLHYAAVFGRLKFIETLLKYGARIDCETANKTTPLLYASRNGQTPCVEHLLEAGANPLACDKEGWTALHYACLRGHYQIAEKLLRAGADPNAANSQGHTPLHHACTKSFMDLVALLLSHKASLVAAGKKGELPLGVLSVGSADAMVHALGASVAVGDGADLGAELRRSVDGEGTAQFADLVIKCAGGESVRCHRCVMAVRAPGVRDDIRDKTEVSFEDVKGQAMRAVVEWAYGGGLPKSVDAEGALELVPVAVRFCGESAGRLLSLCAKRVAEWLGEHSGQQSFPLVGKILGTFVGMFPDAAASREERLKPLWELLRCATCIAVRATLPAGQEVLAQLSKFPGEVLCELLKSLPAYEPPREEAAQAPPAAQTPAVVTPTTASAAARAVLGASTTAAAAAAEAASPVKEKPSRASTSHRSTKDKHGRTSGAAGARAATPGKAMTENDRKAAGKIVTLIKSKANSVVFREPVDEKRDGAPGYFNVIKRPMDLSTLKSNLSSSTYTTAQFIQDGRQIWLNAFTYNPPGSPVYVAAQELSGLFEKKVAATSWDGTLPEASPQPGAAPVPAPAPAPAAAAPEAPVAVKRQAEEVEGAADAEEMSEEEMMQLAQMIERLDPPSLTSLLQIADVSSKGENVELDLGTIPPNIMRRMDAFVRNVLHEDPPAAKRSKRL